MVECFCPDSSLEVGIHYRDKAEEKVVLKTIPTNLMQGKQIDKASLKISHTVPLNYYFCLENILFKSRIVS